MEWYKGFIHPDFVPPKVGDIEKISSEEYENQIKSFAKDSKYVSISGVVDRDLEEVRAGKMFYFDPVTMDRKGVAPYIKYQVKLFNLIKNKSTSQKSPRAKQPLQLSPSQQLSPSR